VIDLPAARAVRRRGISARREYRAGRFRRYFERARTLEVEWGRLAVIPAPVFTVHRLVALEDSEGFALALGIVVANDAERGVVALYTPLPSLLRVDAVHLGDLLLDPCTFRGSRLR